MNESVIARYSELGNEPGLWVHSAQTLFAGSEILRRERERVTANLAYRKEPNAIVMPWLELMLTAFGIECLIKAVWLKQGHRLAQNGKYVPMTNNERHHLVKLCRVVGRCRYLTIAVGAI